MHIEWPTRARSIAARPLRKHPHKFDFFNSPKGTLLELTMRGFVRITGLTVKSEAQQWAAEASVRRRNIQQSAHLLREARTVLIKISPARHGTKPH